MVWVPDASRAVGVVSQLLSEGQGAAFRAGVAAEDVQILRSGYNLVLKHANGTDQATIEGWYMATGESRKREQVLFADGFAGADFADLMGIGHADGFFAIGFGDGRRSNGEWMASLKVM